MGFEVVLVLYVAEVGGQIAAVYNLHIFRGVKYYFQGAAGVRSRCFEQVYYGRIDSDVSSRTGRGETFGPKEFRSRRGSTSAWWRGSKAQQSKARSRARRDITVATGGPRLLKQGEARKM